MAANDSTITDEQEEYEDWIELYNTSTNTIDLSGMYLTDDLTIPTKWSIPAGTIIEPDSFLLIWADNDETDGLLHANFNLNRDGEEIGLVAADGTSILDSIHYMGQAADISYGRFPDGSDNWVYFGTPTPGMSNILTTVDHWETVVYANQTWKYFVGHVEPDADWRELTYTDSHWSQGPGGIGYGDGDDNTVIDPTISLYMRVNFTILNLSKIEQAILHVDYDDAFVAYINDVEVARANIGVEGDHPLHNETASEEHEAVMYRDGIPSGFFLGNQKLKQCLKPGDNILALQVHNIDIESSDLSSTTFFSVGLNDSIKTYGEPPEWFRIPAEFSSNLPIVVINTGGREIPNEPRIVVDMGVIYSGSGKRNFFTDPYNHYNGKISIELRGNTTLDFPKKAYALETQNEDGSNRNVSLLGLPEENDWILYAPYSDKSLMRNVLTFQLANEMGRYAPRTRYCELFLNGDYRGIYVLMEKIKRDSNRVNIAKLTPEDTTGDALTGGYILKLDWWDLKSAGWESEIDGTLFHYHHPQKKDLLPVQRNYIKDYMIDFENVLASLNYLDPQNGYRSYIEIGSFVDFFMSAEVSHNADSYRISTFIYKERDSRGGKLSMGPLWDYNLAYGNQDEGPFGTPYEWSWEIGLDPINFWWERFLSDPVFTDALQERWWELRENIFTGDHIHAIIDSVASYLDEAQQSNFERWPVLGEWVWPNYYVGQTYEDEVRYLKNWIIKRLGWMDEHMPELGEGDVPPDTGNGNQVYKRVQIFPNPSASNTTIRYQFNFPKYVKISIYNSLGQRIKKLVDLDQEPDEYVATWDGTNQDGVPVAGGIYFCVLELDYEVVSVNKLVKF